MASTLNTSSGGGKRKIILRFSKSPLMTTSSSKKHLTLMKERKSTDQTALNNMAGLSGGGAVDPKKFIMQMINQDKSPHKKTV